MFPISVGRVRRVGPAAPLLAGHEKRVGHVLVAVGRRARAVAASALAGRLTPGHEMVSVELRLRVAPERVEHRLVVHEDADEHSVADPLRDGVVSVLGADDLGPIEELRFPVLVGGLDDVGVVGRKGAVGERVPLRVGKRRGRAGILAIARRGVHHDARAAGPGTAAACTSAAAAAGRPGVRCCATETEPKE